MTQSRSRLGYERAIPPRAPQTVPDLLRTEGNIHSRVCPHHKTRPRASTDIPPRVCNGCQFLARLKSIIPGADSWPVSTPTYHQPFIHSSIHPSIHPSINSPHHTKIPDLRTQPQRAIRSTRLHGRNRRQQRAPNQPASPLNLPPRHARLKIPNRHRPRRRPRLLLHLQLQLPRITPIFNPRQHPANLAAAPDPRRPGATTVPRQPSPGHGTVSVQSQWQSAEYVINRCPP